MYSINLKSGIPIYEQIYNKILDLAVSGKLTENTQIPSVRNFAKDARINPNTVAKAYQELERNGIIYSIPGKGSYIAHLDDKFFINETLENFEKTVKIAKDRGITSDTLKEHIDNIFMKGD